jgi:hypothetical protein
MGFVDFRGNGLDFLFREFPHHVLNKDLFFAETEIHTNLLAMSG